MRTWQAQTLCEQRDRLVRRERHTLGSDAQDLASEAVARALASPPPDGNIEPWVERIFQNLKIDRWRTQRPEYPVDTLPLASPEPSAEETVLQAEKARWLAESLASLPPELRKAVSLRVLEEQDEATVCAALGIAPATVRSRLHRALCRLRARFQQLRAVWPSPLSRHWFGHAHASSALAAQAMVVLFVAGSWVNPPEPPAIAPVVAAQEKVDVRLPARAAIPESPTVVPTPAVATPSPPKARHPSPMKHRPAESTTIAAVPTKPPQVLWPDMILVEGLAPRSEPPPLMEIPVDFMVAFEKMIEETL